MAAAQAPPCELPLPSLVVSPTPLRAATLPFFGVEPAILDEKGNEVEGVGQG